MIYVRIIMCIAILWIVYAFMMLGQLFDLFKITNRKITFKRMMIPFYYWIAPQQEKTKNN